MKSSKTAVNWLLLLSLAIVYILLPAASPAQAKGTEPFTVMTGKLSLDHNKGPIRSNVTFEASGLTPDKPVKLIWMTVQGGYKLEGLYSYIEQEYKEREVVLLQGSADANGRWSGTFTVPEGFGGDHTLYIRQDNRNAAQTGYFVEATFSMSPASGPVGTDITITAEGLGWIAMESNWQLTYDNKMTGLISAVSTNGKAVAKIRAAGPPGKHTLTVWHGYLGMAYINHQDAPTGYLPVPTFPFEVTDEKPSLSSYVEAVPASAAGGGVTMPALVNKSGVTVKTDKDMGIVGENITLQAAGLPAGKKVNLIWNTMVGNRISGQGFAEHQVPLGDAMTDQAGNLTYAFRMPEDLGGIPHRIDLAVDGKVYGQTRVLITPSIASMTPMSGPAGTEVKIVLQGVGWTEFDNAFYLTYDNSYTGYMCGFNTQGTVTFSVIATGEPGYHLIDLYPGIYKGKQQTPDVYLAPQLTYEHDHPGTRIPAIRMAFEITE